MTNKKTWSNRRPRNTEQFELSKSKAYTQTEVKKLSAKKYMYVTKVQHAGKYLQILSSRQTKLNSKKQ
jgi:hypothetical protein